MFSDGSPITAEDVKASWLASIEKNTPFAYLFYAIKGVSDYIEGFGTLEDIGLQVVSERVFRVTLEQPSNYFLKVITHGTFSVTSREQLQKDNWDDNPQDVVFSGAYKIKARENNRIELEKNPHFWATDSVEYDSIIVKLYKEEEKEEIVESFINGDIQWIQNAKGIDLSLFPESVVYRFPIFGTSYLFFKATEEPWNIPQVRSAIRLLLPLGEVLGEFFPFPAKSLIPENTGSICFCI